MGLIAFLTGKRTQVEEPWKKANSELGERRRAKEDKRKQEKEKAELEQFQATHNCSVCGYIPKAVSWKTTKENTEPFASADDLHSCRECLDWFCDKHIYQGECKDCWEKELGQALG